MLQRAGTVSTWTLRLVITSMLTAATATLAAQTSAAQTLTPLMPMPEHITQGSGSLGIDGGLRISFEGATEPRLEKARDRFLAQLSRETGILAWPPPSSAQPAFIIHTDHLSEPVQKLGEDESYHLQVTSERVTLSAPNPLGILHGLQTFLQLVQVSEKGFIVPAMTIDDKPRFAWRGLMIDTGRHFIPIDVLRQNLDLMEAAKLNVFHWHLTDDQGFHTESTTYPLLQEKGSDGSYYTQSQVRELVAYARDRGIRVIPEFDMPGHATSWFVGYPELASGKGPYSIVRKWGIFDPAMDPTRETTYTFLDRFLEEMTTLFPDAYFHIGGDECNGKEWDANPRIQEFMRQHHIANDAALQAYFTGRVQKLVTKHGKITTGWDEVLQPDTPKDVIIQSWRGQNSLAVAARQGNRAILSWGYYIDLNEPASQHYAVDPLGGDAASLTPEQQARVLGGEAAMWSEYMTPEIISRRIWPRAAAVAERLWSPQHVTDRDSMYARLGTFANHMPWYASAPQGVDRAMVQRMVGDADIAPLVLLGNIVEPPKEYTRESLRDYTSYTPLNRLVDAVPAESEQARIFNEMAARIAAGHGSAADFAQARQWLTSWRDNDAGLQSLLKQSALTAELSPISLNVNQAVSLGLQALASLESRKPMQSTADQLASLKQLEGPQSVLIDAIVPGVETLVRASGH